MVDASRFHQRFLQLPLSRIVQGLDHIDHNVFVGVTFVREGIIVGEKRGSF